MTSSTRWKKIFPLRLLLSGSSFFLYIRIRCCAFIGRATSNCILLNSTRVFPTVIYIIIRIFTLHPRVYLHGALTLYGTQVWSGGGCSNRFPIYFFGSERAALLETLDISFGGARSLFSRKHRSYHGVWCSCPAAAFCYITQHPLHKRTWELH